MRRRDALSIRTTSSAIRPWSPRNLTMSQSWQPAEVCFLEPPRVSTTSLDTAVSSPKRSGTRLPSSTASAATPATPKTSCCSHSSRCRGGRLGLQATNHRTPRTAHGIRSRQPRRRPPTAATGRATPPSCKTCGKIDRPGSTTLSPTPPFNFSSKTPGRATTRLPMQRCTITLSARWRACHASTSRRLQLPMGTGSTSTGTRFKWPAFVRVCVCVARSVWSDSAYRTSWKSYSSTKSAV
mmetsp:Transcript_25448/g.58673  ORF Transcript_25448/g.58673 Transcript_25448/m.58673 type:complete len:239 (-) Transcript_25448:31-747(-)